MRSRDGEEPPESVSNAMMHSEGRRGADRALAHPYGGAARGVQGGRARRDDAGHSPRNDDPLPQRRLLRDRRANEARDGDAHRGKAPARDDAAGTDITLPIEGIKAIASTGLIHEPGGFGNLPSGEAYLMPVEGASDGVFVVDGSMSGIGLDEERSRSGSRTAGVEISGARREGLREEARAARQKGLQRRVRHRDERRARITGSILEDEESWDDPHRPRQQHVDGRHRR